jgi:hypothetical protein
MKKIALTIFLALCGAYSLFAQDEETVTDHQARSERPAGCPVIYLSTSTGINNNTGVIGFSFDVPVAKYVSLEAGTGLSSWGNKVYLGGKYYLKPCCRGLAFSIGITHNTGVKTLDRPMETVFGKREPVELRLYPKTNISFAVYRYMNLGKKHNRFFVGVGWSENIAGKNWQQLAGDPLTRRSADGINAVAPGGLMVMTGFSFGFSR